MRLARIQVAHGPKLWAQLCAESELAWPILGNFQDWVPQWVESCGAALALAKKAIPVDRYQLLAPVEPGARVFGVGLNYLSHLVRLGSDAPPHPLAYLKADSTLINPNDEIAYPPVTAELDYEIELVGVVGKRLGETSKATDCLLGYTIGNDVSARDAGRALGRLDLFTQKALEGTAPLGPWIVTQDQLGIQGQPELEMQLSINGEIRQKDNTRNMIFPMDELLNYLDARVRLRPGDLVFTGSTHGVGLETGRFLRPGDRVEAKIEGVGTLKNIIGLKRSLGEARGQGRLGLPVAK